MGDMDSGNSGSMQSSSTGGGGDEQEYESRGESSSFPSFFNPTNNYPVNPFDNARLLQLYSLNNGSSSVNVFDHHHHQQQQQQPQQVVSGCNFDSLETANFVAQNNNSNNSSNLEMVWSANKFGTIRSLASDDATCTTPGYNPISTPQTQLGPPSLSSGVPSAENSPRSSNQNQNQSPMSGGGGGRNPKKRSRASRRAPTTVLTTDTSNFRQMVQEFTGIPAPPFSASTFPGRTRLDLFGGLGMGMGVGVGMGMGMGMGMGITTATGMGVLPRTGGGGGSSCNLDPPSYLLRPFAQKILPHHLPQQQQPRNTTSTTLAEAAPPSSSATATNNNNNNVINSSSSGAANETSTFHLSPQNVVQSPNPMFAFQSLLQPSSNQQPASEKYSLSLIRQDSGMENPEPKTTRTESGSATSDHPSSWAGLHQGLGLNHDRHLPPHAHQTNQGVGNFSTGNNTDTISNSQRAAPINASSDNHGGVIRGERGMVDSWICSSD